jgi:hypothetical protein
VIALVVIGDSVDAAMNLGMFVCDSGPIALTETGIYTVRVGGSQGGTPSYQFGLVDATPAPVQAIMLDTPVPGAIDQPGRELSYSFSGTVGQPIDFDVIFNDSNGIGFTLRDPSGSAVLTNITSDQSVTLSANGTYVSFPQLCMKRDDLHVIVAVSGGSFWRTADACTELFSRHQAFDTSSTPL